MIGLLHRVGLAIALVVALVLAIPAAVIAQPISYLGSTGLAPNMNCVSALISYGNYVIAANQGQPWTLRRYDAESLQEVGPEIILTPPPFGNYVINSGLVVGTFGYFITTGFPGSQVLKIDLDTWTKIGNLTLSDVGYRSAAHVDGILYVGSSGTPAKMTRVDLATFTELSPTQALAPNQGKIWYASATVDGIAYFATDSNPATLIKIDTTAWPSFTSLTMPAGVSASMGLTAYGTSLYLAAYSGHLVCVDTSTFTIVGSPLAIPNCSPWQISAKDGYGYINCDAGPTGTKNEMWCLHGCDDVERLPSLMESHIPIVGQYGFTATCASPSTLAKFGPLLSRTPPCNATGVTLTGTTSRRSVAVARRPASRALAGLGRASSKARGPAIRYTVTLANANKMKKPAGVGKHNATAGAFGPAGLVVTLPANTTFVKARVSPRPTATGGGGGGGKHNKTLVTAVYDPVANTVTWPDVPLAAGKKRRFLTYVKVQPGAASPLVFQAVCPNCPQLATQSTVTVTYKAK